MVVSNNIIKEIMDSAEISLCEQGFSDNIDPLNRLKTLSRVAENKGSAFVLQVSSLESCVRYAKDLRDTQLDEVEQIIDGLLANILDAKHSALALRDRFGRVRE